MSASPQMHIVLSADQLAAEHGERIASACAGWATYERIPQELDREVLREILGRTQVLIGWTKPDMVLSSAVETYLCGSAGYDAYVGIGLDRKPGFRLTNGANIMGTPIAEHCMALMLALVRQIPTILEQQKAHHYQRRWQAGEVLGQTACIVGLGGVGSELARRCQAFGLRTIGVCRTPARHKGVVDRVFATKDLLAAVEEADHVFAVLPGGPATQGAHFYTAARGSVTDEHALIDALQSGHLGGAGVDVFTQEPLAAGSPLWDLPNVIVSPHSAGLSNRLNDKLTDLFVQNLGRVREGRPLLNEISPAQIA
jgi:phosphoglycerate dehydrogenase-like enzyme